MPSSRRDPPPQDSAGMLTIGALSRATGVPVETLRTWEQRYGFPRAERKPSGHRVYPVGVASRLRRMADALARGHRAGEVVPASDDDLARLLATTSTGPLDRPAGEPPAPGPAAIDDLLALVAAFDMDRLTALLLADAARLGALDFARGRVAPLVAAVGTAWADGRLDIRHEHVLSERLADLLRSFRLPYDQRAAGPRIILATLPGEAHAIGLQMAALVCAAAGLRVTPLGTDIPPREIALAARDLDARAVGLSVSPAAERPAVRRHLSTLQRLLPGGTALVVGGTGAPAASPGVTTIRALDELDAWARRLAASPLPRRAGAGRAAPRAPAVESHRP